MNQDLPAMLSKDVGLIKSISKKQNIHNQPLEDLIQEAMIKYWQVVDSDHYDGSYAFSTYMTTCLQNNFKHIYKRNKNKIKLDTNSSYCSGNDAYVVDYDFEICMDEVYDIVEKKFGKPIVEVLKLKADGYKLKEISKIVKKNLGLKYSCQTLSIMIKRREEELKKIFNELRS